MEIKFLKAGTGDSILIHHKKYNILIDGGNDSEYLTNEITRIYHQNETLDFLIITHHDDDHIKGILDLLTSLSKGIFGEPKNFIKKIAFNSPKTILKEISSSQENFLSYKQAFEVDKLIRINGLQCEEITDGSAPVYFDDLKIDFLSPNREDLNKYREHQDVFLASDFKCDWKTPMTTLEKFLSDKSQDKSIPNSCSIVVKLECDNKKILLTGDITPHRFNTILDDLVEQNGGKPVPFDLIKLPHHGSYRSLNKELLEKLACVNFVVCTNGRRHFLPNKRGLLKVLKYVNREKSVNFFFNYEESLENLGILEKEKKDYNFDVNIIKSWPYFLINLNPVG